MKRAIVTPPVLPSLALIALKQWLGVTTSRDDAPLSSVLGAALDMCEAFTGIAPLELEAEEVLPATSDWQALVTQPVQAITLVEAIEEDGSRTTIAPAAYEIELDECDRGFVRLAAPASVKRFAVRFIAGLAPDWDSLPEALRHGIIRLAAHQHRERETSGASPLPPASVAALWRPWRRMRLT